MGRGEVEAGPPALLERLVAVELRAIVGRDRAHHPRLSIDELLEASVQLRGRTPREEADHGEARLSLDQRDDAGARLAVAEHGVHFPVPDARAVRGPWRSRRDVPLPGETSPTVVRT